MNKPKMIILADIGSLKVTCVGFLKLSPASSTATLPSATVTTTNILLLTALKLLFRAPAVVATSSIAVRLSTPPISPLWATSTQ